MSKRDSLTHSEYFEDDENKADRFTDDYREDLRLVDRYILIYLTSIEVLCSNSFNKETALHCNSYFYLF
jgi:hypothetical protein